MPIGLSKAQVRLAQRCLIFTLKGGGNVAMQGRDSAFEKTFLRNSGTNTDKTAGTQPAESALQLMGKPVDIGGTAARTIASFIRYSKAFEQLTGVSTHDISGVEANEQTHQSSSVLQKTQSAARYHNNALLLSRLPHKENIATIDASLSSGTSAVSSAGRLSSQGGVCYGGTASVFARALRCFCRRCRKAAL